MNERKTNIPKKAILRDNTNIINIRTSLSIRKITLLGRLLINYLLQKKKKEHEIAFNYEEEAFVMNMFQIRT